MLGRLPRQRLKNAFGAISLCLLLGLAVCLAPHNAIAQAAAPNTAPTTRSTSVDHHHASTGDTARHARSTADKTTADKTASHDDPASQPVDRNHAEEQQRALHAEIQKKFKEFNTAFKKSTLAMTATAHRPPQTGAKVDHAQGQPPSPPASAATAPQKPGGNPQIVAPIRPAPVTIPAAVREASTSAPANPHGPKSMLTTLGGPAPHDPKKGAVLSGNIMHRRL